MNSLLKATFHEEEREILRKRLVKKSKKFMALLEKRSRFSNRRVFGQYVDRLTEKGF